MSEEEKDGLKKWAKGFTSYVLTPGLLLTVVFTLGAVKNQIEQTSLTPEQRTKILYHIETSPNDVDNYVAFLKLDSISKEDKKNKLEAKVTRDKIDSLYSMVEKNTVTVWQLKTMIKKVIE